MAANGRKEKKKTRPAEGGLPPGSGWSKALCSRMNTKRKRKVARKRGVRMRRSNISQKPRWAWKPATREAGERSVRPNEPKTRKEKLTDPSAKRDRTRAAACALWRNKPPRKRASATQDRKST